MVLMGGVSACAPATMIGPLLDRPPVLDAVDLTGTRVGASIAWSSPADAHDREALTAWRRGIGPPVVAGPAATTGASHDTLAIVSWNTHAGRADLRRFLTTLRSGGLTHGVPVNHFVLLLQEVIRRPSVLATRSGLAPRAAGPSDGPRQDILRIAAEERLHLFYAPSRREGGETIRGASEDRGNGMLSTLPLSRLRAIELPFERQRRVALAATVTVQTSPGPVWAMDLVDVHLENRAGERRLWLRSAAARTRQAVALLEALPQDDPLVIGGDLNTWSGLDTLLRLFRHHGLAPIEDDPRPTFGRGGRLDHILARLPPSIAGHTRRLDDRFESDHYPVLACLHW